MVIGNIEIYGTLFESKECSSGFIRNFNENENDISTIFGKNVDDDNSDDSVISYQNPYQNEFNDFDNNSENLSENFSEYSYQSMADLSNFSKNIPGNFPGSGNVPQHKFPLGFSANHKINILSNRVNGSENGNHENGNNDFTEMAEYSEVIDRVLDLDENTEINKNKINQNKNEVNNNNNSNEINNNDINNIKSIYDEKMKYDRTHMINIVDSITPEKNE